jgi:hypothetical protein
MVTLLLFLIACLLFLIYWHLTKDARLEARHQKYLAKQKAEEEYIQALQANLNEKRLQSLNQDLDSQIRQYQKTYKSWSWRR